MDLKEQLKRDEGFRDKPYKDTVGKSTVGYGRNLDDVGISQAEAEVLLENDIERAVVDLQRELPWTMTLDGARRGVLLNMIFNMGIGGVLGFKNTLTLIKQERWKEAAEAMLASKWAIQTGERAQRLAEQMRTGEWK